MRKLVYLVKRNCLVFIRDRGAVFSSLLSMFIVLLLMVVFLGDMNVTNVTEILTAYGGIRDTVVDQKNAAYLVQMWTIAGILIVNSVTVTLTVIGVMVNDNENNRIQSFYTAPIKKSLVALSYIISAILIGTLFCILTFAVAEGYVFINGGALLSIAVLWNVIGYIILNVCVFAVIMYLAAIFIKSESAWSGIATIVGTLIGFLGAIYLPMGSLPEGVANVLKYLPILQGAALMREAFCADALITTFTNVPEECKTAYQEYMGITVVINGSKLSSLFQSAFVAGYGIIALLTVMIILHIKKVNDR